MSLALTREDLAAGALAAAVHGFFLVLLIVGVSWQIHDPQPVMADLWQSLPEEAPAPLPPPPPPAPEPVKNPAPQAKPAPPPEAKPAPQPDTKAADIALEKKKREEQEQLQRKQALEAEKKRQEEEQRLELEREQQKLAEARQREIQRQEEELRRRMLEESIASESSQLQARAAAARRAAEVDKVVARYQDMISAKIRGNTRLPDNLPGNPQVEFRLSVLPSGEIAKITLTKTSGNPAFDQAVQRGIEKSSPLPLPTDRAALEKFRDLDIKHRARE